MSSPILRLFYFFGLVQYTQVDPHGLFSMGYGIPKRYGYDAFYATNFECRQVHGRTMCRDWGVGRVDAHGAPLHAEGFVTVRTTVSLVDILVGLIICALAVFMCYCGLVKLLKMLFRRKGCQAISVLSAGTPSTGSEVVSHSPTPEVVFATEPSLDDILIYGTCESSGSLQEAIVTSESEVSLLVNDDDDDEICSVSSSVSVSDFVSQAQELPQVPQESQDESHSEETSEVTQEGSSDTEESTLVSSEMVDTSGPSLTPQTSSPSEYPFTPAKSVEHVVLTLKRRLVRICRKAQYVQQAKKQKRGSKAGKARVAGLRKTTPNNETTTPTPDEPIPVSTSGAQGVSEAETTTPSVDWIAPGEPVIKDEELIDLTTLPVEVYLNKVEEESGNVLKVHNYATTVETLRQERVEEREVTIDGALVYEQKTLAQTVAQTHTYRVRETSVQFIAPDMAYVQSCVRTRKLLEEATVVDYVLAGVEFPDGPVVDRVPVVHVIPSDEIVNGRIQLMCSTDDPLIGYLLSRETVADDPLDSNEDTSDSTLCGSPQDRPKMPKRHRSWGKRQTSTPQRSKANMAQRHRVALQRKSTLRQRKKASKGVDDSVNSSDSSATLEMSLDMDIDSQYASFAQGLSDRSNSWTVDTDTDSDIGSGCSSFTQFLIDQRNSGMLEGDSLMEVDDSATNSYWVGSSSSIATSSDMEIDDDDSFVSHANSNRAGSSSSVESSLDMDMDSDSSSFTDYLIALNTAMSELNLEEHDHQLARYTTAISQTVPSSQSTGAGPSQQQQFQRRWKYDKGVVTSSLSLPATFGPWGSMI